MLGSVKFETTPALVIRPIELVPSFVNHSAPSGPTAICCGVLIPVPVKKVTATGGDVPEAAFVECHTSATTAVADRPTIITRTTTNRAHRRFRNFDGFIPVGRRESALRPATSTVPLFKPDARTNEEGIL